MLRKGSLTGLLLFGIFFGAGNLIFPPALGAQSGSHFLASYCWICLIRSRDCDYHLDYWDTQS